MRLVMEYTIGDGYTYSATETLPIEYKTKFDAEYEFLVTATFANENSLAEFEWAGHKFSTSDFYDYPNQYDNDEKKYFPPEFYTVDEWFEAYKVTP